MYRYTIHLEIKLKVLENEINRVCHVDLVEALPSPQLSVLLHCHHHLSFSIIIKTSISGSMYLCFFFGEIHLPIFRRVLLCQCAPEWHQELVDGQLRCFTRPPPGVRPGLELTFLEVGALHPVNGGLLALLRAGGPTAGGAGADGGEGDLAAGAEFSD